MPLDPSQISSGIGAALSGAAPTSISGPLSGKLTLAIGQAVSSWAVVPSNVVVVGVATGASGSGTVTGGLSFTPNVSAFQAALAGFTGTTGASLSTGICLGLAATLNSSARYQGLSPVVGSGTDISKVVFANSATLQGVLLSCLSGQGISGPTGQTLAAQLSIGIAALFITGVGRGDGIVTGVGVGPPVSGPTTSGII